MRRDIRPPAQFPRPVNNAARAVGRAALQAAPAAPLPALRRAASQAVALALPLPGLCQTATLPFPQRLSITETVAVGADGCSVSFQGMAGTSAGRVSHAKALPFN